MSIQSSRSLIAAGVMLLLALPVACDKKAPPKPAVIPPAADSRSEDSKALAEFLNKDAKPAPRTGGTLPTGHPPIGGAPATSAPAGTMPPNHPPIGGGSDLPPPPTGPELKYEVPATWQATPAKSPLRKAQFRMPGATASDDGEMVVFFFGSDQGGPVEANIQRWRSFFTTPDGKAIPDDAVRIERFDVGALKVTTIDVAGQYSDTTMKPDSKPTEQTMRLLGAIVETPGGNWFFKGIGPVDTMESHRMAFEKMLRSARQ